MVKDHSDNEKKIKMEKPAANISWVTLSDY